MQADCEPVGVAWRQGPRSVEVLLTEECRDIHTLEVLLGDAQAYACTNCHAEVPPKRWLFPVG